jgi:F0F1-type ATP synthase membrane subunit b/b'
MDASMKGHVVRIPIDIATRVSPQLSAFMDELANDPEREELPTLGDVRAALQKSGRAAQVKLHPQERAAALAEVESLIEEFGAEALAVDFIAAKASEGLSRIIEAAMTDVRLSRNPTLGAVRQAMVNGLTAELVGDGTIDPDADETLLAEIDALIRRFGENAVAEHFIRFE